MSLVRPKAKRERSPVPKAKPFGARVIAIVGPTSSGKSALGVYLAKKLGGEVISADSRQVYRGLDIGTGKVTKREMQGVPHHLLDVASPKKVFTADDFVQKASSAIAMIYHSGHTPIVVGGTGFYADALLGRITLPKVPPNFTLRKRLAKEPVEVLYKLLQKKDSVRARTIEPKHKRRIIRALEIAYALGKNPVPKTQNDYDVLWLGLNPAPKKLETNIRKRLRARLKQGMVAEAKRLHAQGLSYKRMEELGLEYRALAHYLRGTTTKEEMLEVLDRAIIKYAKRQLRWFARNKDIRWVKDKGQALRMAKRFLSR